MDQGPRIGRPDENLQRAGYELAAMGHAPSVGPFGPPREEGEDAFAYEASLLVSRVGRIAAFPRTGSGASVANTPKPPANSAAAGGSEIKSLLLDGDVSYEDNIVLDGALCIPKCVLFVLIVIKPARTRSIPLADRRRGILLFQDAPPVPSDPSRACYIPSERWVTER